MRKYLFSGVLASLLVLTAGCGSSDIGDILGGSTSSSIREIQGVVDSVDLSSRSILLTNVRTHSASLADGGTGTGNTARIYFDNDTTVTYQGRTYRPEDLERGDEISARVDESGGRLIATSMNVLFDAAGTTTDRYASTLRGTVRHVDTSRRTIDIDRGTYGNLTTVEYDSNTEVMFGGRTYRPADLERGDEIDIAFRDLGNGRLLAQDITVVRSTSGTSPGMASSELRGTVSYVNPNNRTIELSQASWAPQFTTGSGNTVVLHYDANTAVEFQGRTYAPTNLERGDVIDVQVRDMGAGSLLAQRIIVVRDVNVSF